MPGDTELVSQRVGGNQKRNQQLTNADKKFERISVFDCHLSPVGRQMAIKNTVSVDF